VPRICWGAFFTLPLRRCTDGGGVGAARNLLLCDDGRLKPTCDNAVSRARDLFERVCPGAPFLPPREEEGGEA